MRKVLQAALGVLLLLTSVQESLATHIRASEIRVRRISAFSLTYEITVIAYRDTGSDIQFGGGVLFVGNDEIQGFDVEPEITLGDEIGFNQFKVEYTFPGPGVFTVGYREENRNEGVLNMFNSVETPFYVETQIVVDPIFGQNDSPILLAPPIDRGAVGSRFIHNPAAVDPEGDSLAYRLIIPRQSQDSLVIDYVDPNDPQFYDDFPRGNETDNGPPQFFIVNQETFTDPVTGDVFQRGDLVWNAPGEEGEYNVAFVVEEWRLIAGVWRQLGFVVRDMQIIVEDSNNERPDLIPPPDLCVVAGTLIEEIIEGTDPDGNDVLIEGFGLPLEFTSSPAVINPPPSVENPPFQTLPAFARFEWQTNCSHVRTEPYNITLKVTDRPFMNAGPPLVEFKTWQIQIVAPPPTGLSATTLPGDAIQLNWDDYSCGNAENIQIWRRVDNFEFMADSCQTGLPENSGYELINTVPVGQTDYLDDNNGEGLAPGAQYCYRLVAEFAQPTGGESIASEEACSIMLADAPVVTNVDVQSTSETEGRVLVRWMEPFEIDQAMFPPPYRYDVFRSEGFSGNANRVLVSERLTDTIFVDTGLNTLTDVYNYRILLYDVNDQLVDSSAVASTVRLEPTPLVEAIELTWSAEVPWTNNSQDFPAHFVFRSVGSDDPANFVQIGAVDVNTNGFVFLDDGTATGEPLDDETTYCYFVTTQGSYGNPAIPTPLLNNSQIGCTQPNDEVPPCTPVGFTIDEAFGCEQFLVNQSCQFSDYQNRLIWENDDNEVCEDDIRTYNIYFSETGEEPFELIANVTDREFVHTGIASYKGCYRISAVDRSGNESGLSEILCNDNCPFYELPNVFTPNGDGSNDTFVPYADSQGLNFDRSLCPRFVESVDFRLYDRLGNELYTYSSGGPENTIFIEWEGQNSSGSQLPSGVYYYVADVKFDVLDSANAEQELRGWVHLLR